MIISGRQLFARVKSVLLGLSEYSTLFYFAPNIFTEKLERSVQPKWLQNQDLPPWSVYDGIIRSYLVLKQAG